ncbi:MAG TPA: NUDIX hydrolase [Oculatellaceae cyanobacterium]|jgi:8-oxo-dGTP pyrophosphatase MutT (NUDIX family)
MQNIQKWNLLNSQLVFDNKWCRIRQDEIELPNGQVIKDFFVNIRPDIAIILAVTPKQEIVFVRQYRHGIREILLELPAGAFYGEKESSIVAAARELEEETGYVAEQLIEIATLYDNPVKDTNKIFVFLAENAQSTGKQSLDITEEIEVVLIPLEQVINQVCQGKISVSGTVAAIFLGLNFLAQP